MASLRALPVEHLLTKQFLYLKQNMAARFTLAKLQMNKHDPWNNIICTDKAKGKIHDHKASISYKV